MKEHLHSEVIPLKLLWICTLSLGLTAFSFALDLLPQEQAEKYRVLFPPIAEPEFEKVLHSQDMILYDPVSIVPGYQDSMGDPKGFRPNTIDSSFINLAVPGGWQRLFARRGLFNFPFGTGGVDQSDNVVKINFWLPPQDQGQWIPIAFWRASFSRTHWIFPEGTQIGEILLLRFTDDDLAVFEIRSKTRTLSGWTNEIYRPFLNPEQLALSIMREAPEWKTSPSLVQLMEHLTREVSLSPRALESQHYPGTFSEKKGALDRLPDFSNPELVKRLLKKTPFQRAKGTFWRKDKNLVTYAPSTQWPNSIVPKEYEAGIFPNTDASCNRCHDQGGRQIRDFHSELMLYGELWGEDQIFSWHPFETSAFLKPDGSIKNFNDDNRRIRKDLVEAGLVKGIPPTEQNGQVYKPIPRDWKYNPVRRTYDE